MIKGKNTVRIEFEIEAHTVNVGVGYSLKPWDDDFLQPFDTRKRPHSWMIKATNFKQPLSLPCIERVGGVEPFNGAIQGGEYVMGIKWPKGNMHHTVYLQGANFKIIAPINSRLFSMSVEDGRVVMGIDKVGLTKAILANDPVSFPVFDW